MESVLLVNPEGASPPVPPVGLEYLAEALDRRGYRVDLVDLALAKEPARALSEAVRSTEPDAVGVTVRNIDDILVHVQSFFLPDIEALVSRIREETRAPVILGGAGFSIQPEEILSFTGADYGVDGCGIPTMHRLLTDIDQGRAEPGAIYRNKSPEYLNQTFWRGKVALWRYQEMGSSVGVNTTSGCTQRCIYCTYPKVSNYKLRLRDPDLVAAEVASLARQGITDLFFADSLFNGSVEHAGRICELLREMDLPVTWHSFLNPRADLLPEELLDAMVASGMAAMQLGVDSGSDRILETLGKDFTAADVERATRLCQARGVPVSYSVLFGAPGESSETIDETFAFIDRVRPDYVDVEIGIRIYRPTALAALAEREGVIAPGDSLCRPVFYPFDLKDRVVSHVDARDFCELCYTGQPVYRQVDERP